MPHSTCLWRHHTLKTTFALCVDDFGVKYFSKTDANHVINTLHKNYNIMTDCTVSLYCGPTLQWNYEERWVDIDTPGYVIRALKMINHPTPSKPQHAPHTWIEPTYGSRRQQPPTDQSSAPLLDEKETKRVQSISGTFLYYGRGVDPYILPTLNKIASEQSKPTTDTSEKCDMLIEYLHTNPNAAIRYHASNMILKVISDAAFLVLPKSRSHASAIYHRGWINNNIKTSSSTSFALP